MVNRAIYPGKAMGRGLATAGAKQKGSIIEARNRALEDVSP
jgi:hypothetical protein